VNSVSVTDLSAASVAAKVWISQLLRARYVLWAVKSKPWKSVLQNRKWLKRPCVQCSSSSVTSRTSACVQS
jgi:hypothetical protein